MINKRLIARLDVKNDALVKGIHLEGLRVLGAPKAFAEEYNKQGIDELFYMDVVASLYNRNSLHNLISATAKKISIPLTVGGGVRTSQDVKRLLDNGADKIVINTAAVKRPEIISELSSEFGSSTIAVSIEYSQLDNGSLGVFVDCGREQTELTVRNWALEVERLGAGEIILTSVDNEGTGSGLDLILAEDIAESVKIPVVVHGGAGEYKDIKKALSSKSIHAVCAASIFHYNMLENGDMKNNDVNVLGNKSFLKGGRTNKKINNISVFDCKNQLKIDKIKVR